MLYCNQQKYAINFLVWLFMVACISEFAGRGFADDQLSDIEKYSEGEIKGELKIVKLVKQDKKTVREDGGKFSIRNMKKPREFLDAFLAKRFRTSSLNVPPIVELSPLPAGYYHFEFTSSDELSDSDRLKLTLRAYQKVFNVAISLEPTEQEGYYLTVLDAKKVADTAFPMRDVESPVIDPFQEFLPTPCTMKNLAGYLQRNMNATVVDNTKLTRTYKLQIRMTGDPTGVTANSVNAVLSRDGLQLEPFKGKQKVLSLVIRDKK